MFAQDIIKRILESCNKYMQRNAGKFLHLARLLSPSTVAADAVREHAKSPNGGATFSMSAWVAPAAAALTASHGDGRDDVVDAAESVGSASAADGTAAAATPGDVIASDDINISTVLVAPAAQDDSV